MELESVPDPALRPGPKETLSVTTRAQNFTKPVNFLIGSAGLKKTGYTRIE